MTETPLFKSISKICEDGTLLAPSLPHESNHKQHSSILCILKSLYSVYKSRSKRGQSDLFSSLGRLCQVAEKRYIPKLLFIGKLSECWRGHFMLLDWRSLSPSLRACCILSTCSCIFFDFKGNSTIELVILSIQILLAWPFGYCQSFCWSNFCCCCTILLGLA